MSDSQFTSGVKEEDGDGGRCPGPQEVATEPRWKTNNPERAGPLKHSADVVGPQEDPRREKVRPGGKLRPVRQWFPPEPSER